MKPDKFIPNHIPKITRIFNIVWGIGLLALASYALIGGSFTIPGKGGSDGITYEGNALIVFVIAAVIGAVNLFIVVADHYDKRNNEHLYRRASKFCMYLAVVLVITASAIQYLNDRVAPVIIGN